MQLTPGDDVRQSQGNETPTLSPAAADGVLSHELPTFVVDLGALVVLVARAWHVGEHTSSDMVYLRIADPIGLDDPAELDQDVTCEGLIAADAFRLGDEAEQPLRVAGRECGHALKRYDE